MGSLLGDWPSYNPHNFSQIRPADPSAQPSKPVPVTYHTTLNKTLPPPNQVISTETRNILLKEFYQKSVAKLRPKRAASDNLTPDRGSKRLRGAFADGSN